MTRLLMTEVFPPQTGGSGRWFWEVYRRLEQSETLILAGAAPGDDVFDRTHQLRVQRTSMKFPTWGVASRSGLVCYRRLIKQAKQLVDQHQVQQVHCGKVLPEGFVAWWLKRNRRVPYLVYVHGEELNAADGSRELRWMTRRVLGSAQRVIANSRNTARLLTDHWGVTENQLAVLHPGVDIDRFVPAKRDLAVRRQLLWHDRPVILTVSRLQKRKGHDQLIRALPKLLPSHPQLLYSIVGDGPEKEALVRLVAELGVDNHVEFRGEVSDADMVTCYQQADLFVLPNRTVDGDFEGFGMVLLEAQACGRPVIAGDSGGTQEAMMCGHSGTVVDCTKIDPLAQAIGDLMSDPQRRAQFGRCGRQWTVDRFGWTALTQQAEALFRGMPATRYRQPSCV